MTTDITELAQLRAELSNPAVGSKDHLRKLALSLVEALEKAQKSNEFLKGQLSELANFNPDWDKLEVSYDSWREIAAELLVAKERIAELESRTVTVKLPNQTDFDDPLSAYEAIEKCKEALTAAGITLLHTTNKEEIPMQEKINELSVVIANFLHEEDPEEFCEENSGNRAELLADKLAEFLVNNGHA